MTLALPVEGTRKRVEWIDVARGFAIILIMFHHSRDYALALLPPRSTDIMRWAYIDPLLVHVRLPLFFAISGMVAFGLSSRKMDRIPSRRTAALAAVYIGWSIAMAFIIPAWPNDEWRAPDVGVLADILRGGSVLWYIWALILAHFFTSSTIRLPVPVAVGASCLIGMCLVRYEGELGGAFGPLGHYLPLYVAGARCGAILTRLSALSGIWHVSLVIAAYVLRLNGAVAFLGKRLALDFCGAAAGIVAASQIARKWSACVAPLTWLGRRTLPVYVLHFPIVALLGCAAIRAGSLESRATMLLLFLPLLTFSTLALSLVAFLLAERAGLSWAFAMKREGADELFRRRPVTESRRVTQ